jgi:pseudomonalisin/xanthomonalisin
MTTIRGALLAAVGLLAVGIFGPGSGRSAGGLPALGLAAPTQLQAQLRSDLSEEQRLARRGLTAETSDGLFPLVAPGAAPSTPLPPKQRLTLSLALPIQNRPGLSRLIREIYTPGNPEWHHFLTPRSFTARFTLPPARLDELRAELRRKGLRPGEVSPNHLLMPFSGTVGQIDKLFHTDLVDIKTKTNQILQVSLTAGSLPLSLKPLVSAVLGLSNLDSLEIQPADLPGQDGKLLAIPARYNPNDFFKIYNATGPYLGQGQTIAIIAEGSLAQTPSDLYNFDRRYHLPQIHLNKIRLGKTDDNTDGSLEWDLDTEYASSWAPKAKLVVYAGRNFLVPTMVATVNEWVTQDIAKEASFSVGECETTAAASGFEKALDAVLMEAVAQGQSFFSPTGDNGASCHGVPLGIALDIPIGQPGVDYPAASPYAVAVGGTSLLGGPGPLREVAWLYGGGGPSITELAPSYQAHAGGTYLGILRGTPDVSLDADPETGYDVIQGSGLQVVGGTSASTPSWMGIWARAQSAHGGNLGFANYTIYSEPQSAFNQILVGLNGLWPATPGWSYAVGRGSPNVDAFVNNA